MTEPMHPLKARLFVTASATLIALTCSALAYWQPDSSTFWLTAEVILLPAVYIIGGEYIEHELREEHARLLVELERRIYAVNQKYYILQKKYVALQVKQ